MTRLLGAELFKLRTTRTFYGLVGGCLAMVLVVALLIGLLGHPHANDDVMRGSMGLLGGLAQAFAMVLGILVITTEFRHGTITPTLLVAPRRIRLLVAKLGTSALAGLLLGLLATGLIALLIAGLLSARGYDDGSTGSQVVRMIAGGTLAAGLYALVGFGFGAIVRNQVGAIIGALVFVLVVEPLLTIIPTVGDWVQKYGLGGSGSALSATVGADTDGLSQVPGGLLFAAYAAILVVIGIVLIDRRDISA
jgi:ABC-2 type transport system permease protein